MGLPCPLTTKKLKDTHFGTTEFHHYGCVCLFSQLGLKGFLSEAVLVFALPGVHYPKFVCPFGHFCLTRCEQGRGSVYHLWRASRRVLPPLKAFQPRGREVQPAGCAGLLRWGLCPCLVRFCWKLQNLSCARRGKFCPSCTCRLLCI